MARRTRSRISGRRVCIVFRGVERDSACPPRLYLGNMKALKNWAKVNEAFYQYVVEPNKGKEFVAL